MACCRFKQSTNDVLFDNVSGKPYCGSCWQSWVGEKAKCSNTPRRPQSKLLSAATNNCAIKLEYEDDNNVGELEAVVSGEGASFHLVSKKLSLVFHSERTESGKLRCVGRIGSDGEVIIDGSQVIGDEPREYPFEPNPADHCETPLAAYVDIAPVLEFLGQALGKEQNNLSIYDPYYCDGAVKRNLAHLGFSNVYNRCEDFYARVNNGTIPAYDALVTNPPYIATEERDHVESLLRFAVQMKKPFFILQPNYVYTKPYWQELTSSIAGGPRPFFLTPGQPREYVYETPRGLRDAKSSQRKTSPFATMWYCWLGTSIQASFFRNWGCRKVACPGMTLVCSEYFIPDNFKDSNDKTRKKSRKQSLKRKRGSRE